MRLLFFFDVRFSFIDYLLYQLHRFVELSGARPKVIFFVKDAMSYWPAEFLKQL